MGGWCGGGGGASAKALRLWNGLDIVETQPSSQCDCVGHGEEGGLYPSDSGKLLHVGEVGEVCVFQSSVSVRCEEYTGRR